MKTPLITAAVAALMATAATAQDVVRLGTEGAYPPYNFINDDGEVDGFERELGDEICARAELNCEWVMNDWDSIIPNLTSGNYDVIMAGMTITEEREQVVGFSQPYYPPTASAYMAGSEDANYESGVVSAQIATIQSAHIAESDATLLEFANPEESIQAVRDGEADAVFADWDYLLPIVEASGGEMVFVGDRIPIGGGIAPAFRKGDDTLRGQFNEVLDEMKEDGSLNEMLAKWFADEASVPQF